MVPTVRQVDGAVAGDGDARRSLEAAQLAGVIDLLEGAVSRIQDLKAVGTGVRHEQVSGVVDGEVLRGGKLEYAVAWRSDLLEVTQPRIEEQDLVAQRVGDVEPARAVGADA